MLLRIQEQRCYVPSRSVVSRVVWRRLRNGSPGGERAITTIDQQEQFLPRGAAFPMNASVNSRVKRLEDEQRFNDWLQLERFLESLTEEQLEDLVTHWRFPDPWPDPLPFGKSRLDGLDRKTLIRL